jgi:hypothetical protein
MRLVASEIFEHLAAFFLGLGECAQACQPDLLRRFLDGAGQLRAGFLVGVVRFFGFRDHDETPGVG